MMLSEAKASPEGTPVAYTGGRGEPETGWITGASNTMVFVRYGQDVAARATRPADLEFLFPVDAHRARSAATVAPGGGTGPRGASVNTGASFSNGPDTPRLIRLSLPPVPSSATRFGLGEGDRYS